MVVFFLIVEAKPYESAAIGMPELSEIINNHPFTVVLTHHLWVLRDQKATVSFLLVILHPNHNRVIDGNHGRLHSQTGRREETCFFH